MILYAATIPGAPRTKKNSMQIIQIGGKPRLIQSKQYREYKTHALEYLHRDDQIAEPCNVQLTYYMPTRRRVDLSNLQAATLDLLVDAGVLSDDNSQIVQAMDGSRVFYDKETPRVEIIITAM